VLRPGLARRLLELGVEIRSHRDLPGLLPLVGLLLLAGGMATWLYRRPRAPASIFRAVWAVIFSVLAVEFYLWYWTNSAEHNPLGSHQTTMGMMPVDGFPDLLDWQRSMYLQVPVWVCGVLVLRKFLQDYFLADFTRLLVGALFVLLFLGTLLMFRPDPYWHYAALSWWPLVFALSILGCGLLCLEGLRHAAPLRRNA